MLGGILLSFTSFSQENNSLKVYFPEIKMSPPESSKLSQHLFYPVNKALGLVNISIPLFEIPTPADPISFSISYHASGIKVEDPIGILGYGWNLFPATRIIRENNGKPDEYCKLRMPSTFSIESIYDSISYYATPTEFDFPSWGYDAEHDVFSVSVNNESVSFVTEKMPNNQFKVLKIKDSYLKIDVVADGLGSFSGFEIRDNQGVIYNYGDRKGMYGYVLATDSEVASNTSAYLLSSIDYPNGQSISFTYELTTLWKDPRGYAYGILIEDCCHDPSPDPILPEFTPFNLSSIEPLGAITDYVISTITFPLGQVAFEYDSHRLSSIQMLDNNSNVVKTVSFEPNQHTLRSVDISDKGKYLFDYNPITFANAYAQDEFGYYNGNMGATYLSVLPDTLMRGLTNYSGGDRLTNERFIQANMLNKITYPTGGIASFEYELNKGNTQISTVVKAGLRIKKVNQYDPVSKKTITKTYKYGKNESGYGIATDNFNILGHYSKKKVNFYSISNIPKEVTRRIISPYNYFISLLGSQPKIWYDEVTEYTDEGKIVEEYIYTPDEGNGFKSEVWHYIYEGPLLTKQKIYKKSELAQETEWEYDCINSHRIVGYHIAANTLYFSSLFDGCMEGQSNQFPFYKKNITYTIGHGDYGCDFNAVPYSLQAGRYQPIMKRVKLFENQSIPLETTEYYYYHQEESYNLDEKIVTDSRKQDMIEKTYYANNGYDEYPFPVINLLKENNYLTTPIAKEFYRVSTNTIPLRGEKIIYDQIGPRLIKPTSFYIRNKGMGGFEKQVDYSYYPNGNLATIKEKNGLQSVFLWGYNSSYIVAEIKNATIVEVSAIVGNVGQMSESASDISLLDVIRSRLPHAMVTTYVHVPLVGITSITDSRGNKIVYSYNAKNQLIETYRLVNGVKQYIQTNEYKYATENP